MAFKYINAAISGEYQKILSRLIENPESLNLSDTPTYNLPLGVPQTGNNVDGVLTGSLKSIELDGLDDFLKLPTSQGLGTEILLEGIGGETVKHGATTNNIALESWVKLDSTITGIDTNSEFYELTIQRNSVSSTTGFDGNYMARTIYAVSAQSSIAATVQGSTSAHFIDFQFASGGNFAYSLTSNNNVTLDEWHHIWCEYTVTSVDNNTRFTPDPRGWMRIYIDGTLNRQEPLSQLMASCAPGANLLPFPSTGSAVSYGYDRAISFDGKLDEMRLWLNTGTTNSISTLASKANIGIKPEQFSSQTNAAQVKLDFSPSAEYLAAWWRFETISAVDLFASVADSIPDTTKYGHSATPQNFVGTLDYSEEQTIVSGITVSGLNNAVSGQVDLDSLRGGTYDHGGMCVVQDNENKIILEQGSDNLVTCASNSWTASGGASVNFDVLNIFMGSSAYTINTTAANQGGVHTINYNHLLFDKNDYTMSLRLLLTSGSTSARVTFTLGDKATSQAVTAVMDRNVWLPVVVRNTATLPTSESTITGEVSVQSLGDATNANGALLRVDALDLREGFYPGSFIGPQQTRKGGEISWDVID
jgi:hypothetical protein